ncbi:MAG: hypothetical protein HYT90_00825 [Candidatus Omnitrophica bacterium]|nr:hypothetical protein [Candidatus Omnitrophota bacterium]
MFLATTALSDFWDTQEELLFLGPWCLREDRRQEWEGLRYQLLPNPWEDRQRFDDSAAYLDAYGERLLGSLTDYLNAAHRVSHGTRYWRILIGPWLIHYLHAVYDRYVRLTEAFSRHPTLRTTVLDPGAFRVPPDTLTFVTGLGDDPSNLQMFSEQLAHLGYAFPRKPWAAPEQMAEQMPKISGWRGAVREARARGYGLLEGTAGWIRRAKPHAALCEMSCSRSWLWALAWRSRLRAIPRDAAWDRPVVCEGPIFDERRKGLAALSAASEFEQIAVRSLPQHVPTLYLEGYDRARDATLSAMRQAPPVIVSAAGWHYQEPFKFLAAEASARGSRLIAVQHGGGYGLFRHAPMEQHERRAADTFLAWGWADHDSTRALGNLPSPRLSQLFMARYGRPANRSSETLLFVSTAHLRYPLRFDSCPIGIDTPAYLQWQLRFLAAIPDRLRRVIRFRPYPQEFGYAVRDQVTRRVGPLQWDGRQPLAQTLNEARLVVIDHSGTTFLEALRHGVPTVLFWDPRRSEVRDEAAPFVETLRGAGILHDSPEAAAAHIGAIYDQPSAWWERAEVQEARHRFIERYALGRREWLTSWTRAVQDGLAASRETGSDGQGVGSGG